MASRFLYLVLLLGLLTAGCTVVRSDYGEYKNANSDYFARSNHCAAAELIRYLLPELGREFGPPDTECSRRGWRGAVALGGYGRSIGYAAHAGKTGFDIRPPATLVIASLVDLDDLNRSSTLGRVMAEQVSATFTKTGYQMRELKLGQNVYVRQQGELMLTREVRELARLHDAQAVVVGTYATSDENLYVNLKVIRPQNNLVLAAHDYVLPIDDNVSRLLWSRQPVRP